MIRVTDLSYQYRGNKTPTLSGISLTVKDGEVVALVGQNGSGKSTLGRLIAGIYKIQSGTVAIGDQQFDKKSSQLCPEVAIVFQNPENQIIFSRVDDEIGFSLQGLDQAEIEQRITMALAQVGMSDYRDQDLYNLSLGQKQRIVIAEALARHPKYLILDEPTTMIDSQGKEEIYQLILQLKKQGYTIICITNLADEMLLADRTLILADGHITAEIKRSDLIKKSRLLAKYQIHQPTLLKILSALKRQGLEITPRDWTVAELARQIAKVAHADR